MATSSKEHLLLSNLCTSSTLTTCSKSNLMLIKSCEAVQSNTVLSFIAFILTWRITGFKLSHWSLTFKKSKRSTKIQIHKVIWYGLTVLLWSDASGTLCFGHQSKTTVLSLRKAFPKLLELLLWTDRDTNGYDTIEATHQQFKTTTNIDGTKCANCKGTVWIRQQMSWKCKLLGPSSWRSTFQWRGCRVIEHAVWISCDKLQQGKTGRSVGLHAIYGTVHMTIPSLWNEFDHLLGRLRALEENKIQAENHERDAPSLKSAQLPKTETLSRNMSEWTQDLWSFLCSVCTCDCENNFRTCNKGARRKVSKYSVSQGPRCLRNKFSQKSVWYAQHAQHSQHSHLNNPPSFLRMPT